MKYSPKRGTLLGRSQDEFAVIPLGQFRMIFGAVVVRVFDDSLADFERQIEPAKRRVAKFEVFDDAERVQVDPGKTAAAPGQGAAA